MLYSKFILKILFSGVKELKNINQFKNSDNWRSDFYNWKSEECWRVEILVRLVNYTDPVTNRKLITINWNDLFFFIAQTHGLPDQKRVKVHRKSSQSLLKKSYIKLFFRNIFRISKICSWRKTYTRLCPVGQFFWKIVLLNVSASKKFHFIDVKRKINFRS